MSTVTTFVDKKQAVEMEKTILVKAENTLDFSELNVADLDVVEALDIPAGAFVFKVGVNVLTAETGSHTLGDADDADGWDTVIDTSATGVVVGDGAYAAGKLYTSADTIDLTIGADLDSGKVSVFALYAQLEDL